LADGALRAEHLRHRGADCQRAGAARNWPGARFRLQILLFGLCRSRYQTAHVLGSGQRHFSALPFIYGTLVSSFLSLLLAVPLAIGVAIFLTEMCPALLRGPLAFLTELLAAIPSVIYGLWAVFVLVPLLREYVNPLLIKTMGWTGFFAMTTTPPAWDFSAGVILAIMILPIISSLTREVMTAVPHSQREAVLALGATRWEMIRMGVLRNARIGIVGASFLAWAARWAKPWRSPWSSATRRRFTARCWPMAARWPAVIANEFAEAVRDLHLSALMEIGLALFVVTIIVNALPGCWCGRLRAARRQQVH
jgi:phosphate transport system permease protein